MHLTQTPAAGSSLLQWAGDVIEITLKLDRPVKGRAAFRTNVGNAHQQRLEIIEETERDVTPLAKAWHDIPMTETRPGVYKVQVALDEVGIFSGKCCFFPAGSDSPCWPDGDNLRIKVGPAATARNNSIYTAYTRQFGAAKTANPMAGDDVKGAAGFLDGRGFTVIPPSGTFRDVKRELDHILGTMGFRILQLLPIFPVPTTFARMGRFGSSFAATDFLSVDPACAEFDDHASPLDQFVELADAVHARGGSLYVDLPANHTGWAATLMTHHPDWYHRETDGKFVSPGAWGVTWADLVELDYKSPELRAYMADVFLFWCRHGVDGFRCDAGYMIPEATWNYIVARVREEYPDTVFMLEGLGGPVPVTEALLSRSDLDWAYSETFQTFDRRQFEWYLPNAISMAERCGPLVHFAETHDNDRLAKGGHAWARLRVALSALLSHQGSWGMANGVEWYATEKIDVHGASCLNWGAADNMVPLISKLNALLATHPAFGPHTHLKMIQCGGGNCLAVKREYGKGGAALVLLNLDCGVPCVVKWNAREFPCHKTKDLITGTEYMADPAVGIPLPPGGFLCLGAEEVDPLLSKSVKDEAPTGYVTRWVFPEDVRREVPVPFGSDLLVSAEHRFRVQLTENGRTLAFADSGSDRTALLKMPSYVGGGTAARRLKIEMSVYRLDEAEHTVSDVLVLPRVEDAKVSLRVNHEALKQDPDRIALLQNGAGADSYTRVAWGEIGSKYESLFSANPNPRVPSDRISIWPRCRAWLQNEGYSHEINRDCQISFSVDPGGAFVEWTFGVPCGMGRLVSLKFRLELARGSNAARLTVLRVANGGDVRTPVRLVFRPDVEWRSFHECTKAFAGCEKHYPKSIRARANGFTFAPYGNERFDLEIDHGEYHNETLWSYMVGHPVDAERGQDATGDLFSPGWFVAELEDGNAVSLTGTYSAGHAVTPVWPVITALPATMSLRESLSRSIDVFIQKRDELKTVLAGYPWFLDWGRDTLIFLRGLIAAGRTDESLAILTEFARFEENGTIPNIIHGETAGNRDTTDAQLWLIIAAKELVSVCGPKVLETNCGGRPLSAVLESIVENYVKGTPNGIHVDKASGLVWSPNHFTWMDTNYPACTPRIGYPVEIQAMWISALRFLGGKWSDLADKAVKSLVKYYYDGVPGHGFADCLDAVNGEPAAKAKPDFGVRPNELFLLALEALPADDPKFDEYRRAIITTAEQLVVPGGMRSVAATDKRYRGAYTGDEDSSRKPAYHNGTIWGWVFPMYAEAIAKSGMASRETALSLLTSSIENLNHFAVAHASENADGDAPHRQKGCLVQAWSESELLRVLIELGA